MSATELKKVFNLYQRKSGSSITETSKKLDWASSKLGLFLTGARKISVEDAIVAANFFNVDPREIKPDCVMPQVLRIRVDHVTSGNPPHALYRDFPIPNLVRFCIYVDHPLVVEKGEDAVDDEYQEKAFLPKNSYITCNAKDEPIPQSTTWPITRAPSWILKKDDRFRIIKNVVAPKKSGWEVLGYIVSIRYF